MADDKDRRAAKLYAVEGSIDRPARELEDDASAVVEVQFNPTSLKVTLANSLKENERSGNTRAAQFVDKSSSSLTVELIFDTTDQLAPGQDGGEDNESDQRQDVRLLTGAIARTFMQPNADAADSEEQAPHRCMFAWGTFVFVGIMESFDETLDFFSPEGTPLRATVAIKIAESRYQFRSQEAQQAQRDTPTLGSASEAMNDASWRDTALFNGVENPRAPGSDSLSEPGRSGMGGMGGSGAAPSLGTSVPGAFPGNGKGPGAGGMRPSVSGAPGGGAPQIKALSGVGFD